MIVFGPTDGAHSARSHEYSHQTPVLTSSHALKGARIPSARRRRPAARMFFAALTSRSWTVPQSPQVHALIPRPAMDRPHTALLARPLRDGEFSLQAAVELWGR